jgi:hypothetical protein
MLRRVLQELESAQSPLDLNELSRKLGLERSALDGMIEFWVRKGRLKDDARQNEQIFATCGGGSCGGTCPGPQGCPYILKMPRTFSLTLYDADE